jgi:hypothetical protein
MIVSEVNDKFGRKITLTKEKQIHIISRTEMKGQESRVKQTLTEPDEVRESLKDKTVFLYYRLYKKTPVTQKYMLVAVKVLNKEGHIITAFYTDRIKKGELIWKKD